MAAPPVLPDAVCVHCGKRFNSANLVYTMRAAVLHPAVAAAYVPLQRDAAATDFLLACGGRSSTARYAQSVAASALRTSLSLTDANGIVGRGGMHCLSTAQALQLLRPGQAAPEARGTLLDVGAGNGSVTAHLAPLFDRVFATEVSQPMLRRLRAAGFAALDTGDVSLEALQAAALSAGVATLPAAGFDCVSLLNVLDRCDAPTSLLLKLRRLLAPDARLLLAVVLPFRPFVELGTQRRPPRESLGLSPSASFEDSVNALWTRVLQPLGFRLHAVSRVPYVSDGDEKCPTYVLDDAVFVLSPDGGQADQ